MRVFCVMSHWIEITNKEDIEIDGDDVEIYIGSDDAGNNYVTVPKKLLISLLLEDLQ